MKKPRLTDADRLAIARLSTFETKARVLRGLSYAFLNYQIKVFTTPPADAVCAASELTFGGGCAGSVSPSWFKRILTSSFGST